MGVLADLIVAQAKRVGGINEKILKELFNEVSHKESTPFESAEEFKTLIKQ
jgi:hypothetical protein